MEPSLETIIKAALAQAQKTIHSPSTLPQLDSNTILDRYKTIYENQALPFSGVMNQLFRLCGVPNNINFLDFKLTMARIHEKGFIPGNSLEFSFVIFHELQKYKINAEIISVENGDHFVVVINRNHSLDLNTDFVRQKDLNAFVIDGLFNIYYPASQIQEKLKTHMLLVQNKTVTNLYRPFNSDQHQLKVILTSSTQLNEPLTINNLKYLINFLKNLLENIEEFDLPNLKATINKNLADLNQYWEDFYREKTFFDNYKNTYPDLRLPYQFLSTYADKYLNHLLKNVFLECKKTPSALEPQLIKKIIQAYLDLSEPNFTFGRYVYLYIFGNRFTDAVLIEILSDINSTTLRILLQRSLKDNPTEPFPIYLLKNRKKEIFLLCLEKLDSEMIKNLFIKNDMQLFKDLEQYDEDIILAVFSKIKPHLGHDEIEHIHHISEKISKVVDAYLTKLEELALAENKGYFSSFMPTLFSYAKKVYEPVASYLPSIFSKQP